MITSFFNEQVLKQFIHPQEDSCFEYYVNKLVLTFQRRTFHVPNLMDVTNTGNGERGTGNREQESGN